MVVFPYLGSLSLLNLFYLITAYAYEETSIDNVLKGCWDHNQVPYRIVKAGFTEEQINDLKQQINVFNTKTCISWFDIEEYIELQNLTRFVQFHYKTKVNATCHTARSTYNMTGGEQLYIVHVQLAEPCFRGQTILHELLHVLGFHHEHQRADRDCYVDVAKKVRSNHQFKKIKQPWLERFPYDKMSEMHYYRSNKMRAKHESFFSREPLGRRGVFSDLDLWKVQYKFCGREHFCDNEDYGWQCEIIEQYEKKTGCAS